jgi:hypothetical protein
MLKKILFLIISFSLLSQCGFTPLYSTKESEIGNFSINSLRLSGDKNINNYIKINLSKFENNSLEKKFNIDGETFFYKDILSNDKSANVSDYKLSTTTFFKVYLNSELKEEIRISEEKIMENMDDKLEEEKYEKTVKKIFASSISKKLITELSLINDN